MTWPRMKEWKPSGFRNLIWRSPPSGVSSVPQTSRLDGAVDSAPSTITPYTAACLPLRTNHQSAGRGQSRSRHVNHAKPPLMKMATRTTTPSPTTLATLVHCTCPGDQFILTSFQVIGWIARQLRYHGQRTLICRRPRSHGSCVDCLATKRVAAACCGMLRCRGRVRSAGCLDLAKTCAVKYHV